MSNQPVRHPGGCLLFLTVLLIAASLLPPVIHGEETKAAFTRQSPLLVGARPGDTPATLAQRYLEDASKGWMIREYNDEKTISGGEAVVVPRGLFRPGGLFPEGYQTVPVLAYADIGGATGQKGRLSSSAFKHQLSRLTSKGFTAITPTQLTDFMAFSDQLPQRAILITADTESQTFHDLAVPALKAHGFTATLFVAVDRVGTKGSMNWDQLRQLQNAGFTIGCRGRYGRALTRRKKNQSFEANFRWIESELRQAKKEIETHLGRPCLFLAYPQGRTSGLVSAMAAKLGFSAAFSLSPGGTPFFGDRFGIHRTVIDGRFNADQFASLLTTFTAAGLK